VKWRVQGHDQGEAYRVMFGLGPDIAMTAFGLFGKLLEIAADEPRERRDGTIHYRGRPATEELIALMTLCPLELVRRCLDLLCHEHVGWVERVPDERWEADRQAWVAAETSDSPSPSSPPTQPEPVAEPSAARHTDDARPTGDRRATDVRPTDDRRATDVRTSAPVDIYPVPDRTGNGTNNQTTGTGAGATVPRKQSRAGPEPDRRRPGAERVNQWVQRFSRCPPAGPQFGQIFAVTVDEACRLSGAESTAQRKSLLAMGERLTGRADRDALAAELVELAVAKRCWCARPGNRGDPWRMWQAEANERLRFAEVRSVGT
jgi:hypothetical protein